MCGKFTQRKNLPWREFHDLLDMIATQKAGDAPAPPKVEIDVETITPMRFVPILRLDAQGQREWVAMRWGFSALSAVNPAKPDHIHARAETIDVKPTFRAAFRERRGVLLVDSFNEGEELTPSRTLQYVVTPESGGLLAIAVLWEAWHHDDGSELLTFVMATVPPNSLLGEKFDRMPAVLAPDDIAAWLGETEATPDELKAMLVTTEGRWSLCPEKKEPPPRKPKTASPQGELF